MCDAMYELNFKEPGSLKANKQHAFKMAIILKSPKTREELKCRFFGHFLIIVGQQEI